MAFNSVKQIADAVASTGDYQYAYYYKPATPSPGATGRWTDTSSSTGRPKYNAYVGAQLDATPMIGAANFGIYVGPVPSGKQRHLLNLGMRNSQTSVPGYGMLCDYLMFYPLIDLDDTDLQEFTNVSTLPRYTDGNGVRIMFVNAVQSTSQGIATVVYVNQSGVQKTVTASFVPANSGVLNTCGDTSMSTAATTPFFPLASGDTGVRSLVSIQLTTPPGGFCHAVLIKPLATIIIHEQNTHTEVNLLCDKLTLPKIVDGAYLNFLYLSNVNAQGILIAELVMVDLDEQVVETIEADGAPFSFVPSELSGLEFWLKADAGLTESAGTVTAWNDQSGNSRNPTVQSNPSYTASGLNGMPTVTFDGTNDWLQLTTALTLSLAGKSAMEMIVVLRRNNSSRLDPLIDLSINSTVSMIYHDIPSNDLLRVGGVSDLIDSFNEQAAGSAFVEDAFEMVSLIVNPSTDRLKYYLNNAQSFNASKSFNSSTFATSTGTQNGLFAYFDGTATAAITVAEVIIYSSELSDADKDKVAWYLNDKYNIGATYLIGDPSL